MGLFELDADGSNGIEVKKTTKTNFSPLKSYCFPECQSKDSSNYVDEYGQIHRNNASKRNDYNGAYVDEFGQIIRPNSSKRSSSSSSSSTSSSSSSTSPNYSSNNDGWETFCTFLRVIATIVIVALVIAIIVGTGGIATPTVAGAYFAIRAIWDDN